MKESDGPKGSHPMAQAKDALLLHWSVFQPPAELFLINHRKKRSQV